MPATTTGRFWKKILYRALQYLPIRPTLSDLETASADDLLFFGELSVIPAFRKAARFLPFYGKLLAERGVDVSTVRTIDDFRRLVPIIVKADVFPIHDIRDLCQNGTIRDMRSAIVTSGTSGTFACGLLTDSDITSQREMVDMFFDQYFPTNGRSLLIINALAMGVAFSSGYPVIPTGVRSDIVIHVIRTFQKSYEKIVIVCDPNFAKKILDEGDRTGLIWQDLSVSFVVGGSWFSNSLTQYALSCIRGRSKEKKNLLLGTMGLTEIALNIFSAPDDLITLRNILQNDPILLTELFGEHTRVCPEILYYYPTRTYIEIPVTDGLGRGTIVVSNLDTHSKTPLFRYNTGDTGMFIERDRLGTLLKEKGYDTPLTLGLPLIAVFEREDAKIKNQSISVSEVKEALFRDHGIVPFITGHFRISADTTVEVQLSKDVIADDALKTALRTIVATVSGKPVDVVPIPYRDFANDMEVTYEGKWKHLS